MDRRTVMAAMVLAWVARAAGAAERGTPDQAVAMVKRAVAYAAQHGKDKALAEINNPKGMFTDRDLYLFAISTTGDGIELAHGNNIKLVGKNMLELRDADGKYMVKEFLAVANGKGSGWVDYKWPNPLTKAVEAKTSYIEKAGDMLIGCGVYK